MNKHLPWFRVDLLLEGIDSGSDSDALENMEQELASWSHLNNVNITWTDAARSKLLISVESLDIDAKQMQTRLEEEILEASSGVLRGGDLIQISTISCRPL